MEGTVAEQYIGTSTYKMNSETARPIKHCTDSKFKDERHSNDYTDE